MDFRVVAVSVGLYYFVNMSIDQNNPDLDLLFEFLRFPSISTDSSHSGDMRECANWLSNLLAGIGLEANVCQTPGHPVVLAASPRREGLKTLLIYGHYDVQPADPLELWKSPPFEPVLENRLIRARGATDNKGQILAHILGTKKWIEEHGDLPLNIIYMIEGEEEVGSDHLEAFLQSHRDELACDVIAVSDTGMLGPGIPTFTYGLRGIVACEVFLKGPSKDLHSGIFGGAVANPAIWAGRLVASLHDSERRVAIPGFYDQVRDLEDWERDAWRDLPLNEDALLEITGAPALDGEAGFTALERIWARPTAEVNGIGGGYQGEGTKTVLPSEAGFKLTFRLVPDQSPGEILLKATEHLRSQCPPSISIDIRAGHSGAPYLVDPNSPNGEAAMRALKMTFGADAKAIREGGSIPVIQTFKEVLGVDTLLLGLALPDCNAHSPNETFPVENFEAGMRLNRALIDELSGINPNSDIT